jgi:hypothetical protein
MATFTERLVGAAKLDKDTFEEVEMDRSAMNQALAVVVLASVAAGIGSGRNGLIAGIAAALVGWFIWAGLTYLIGTRLLPTPQTHADWGQLLRTTGFSASPGILRLLGFVPILGSLIFAIANLWMLAAFVVAVRQALDYDSTWRAVGVCLIGWIIFAVLSALFIRF